MSDLLREAVRCILLETFNVSERATMAVAAFVSGETLHDKFNIASFKDELRPFIKRYNNLYRVWQRHDASVPENQLEAEAKARSVMSTTRDPSTIPDMLDMFGASEGKFAVTKLDGIGFDPYDVLRAGLQSNTSMREAGYVRAILQDYAYQQEIIVLQVVGRVIKVNR